MKDEFTEIYLRAVRFGANAHRGQKRKFGKDEDYFDHCLRVANSVLHDGGDANMVIAALLHDTIEDTHVSRALIEQEFGEDVADLVMELTDVFTSASYPDCNRAARKQMETERLRSISDRAKRIKRWDIADNTRDIVANDPGFAPIYLREKAAVLEAIGYNGDEG